MLQVAGLHFFNSGRVIKYYFVSGLHVVMMACRAPCPLRPANTAPWTRANGRAGGRAEQKPYRMVRNHAPGRSISESAAENGPDHTFRTV